MHAHMLNEHIQTTYKTHATTSIQKYKTQTNYIQKYKTQTNYIQNACNYIQTTYKTNAKYMLNAYNKTHAMHTKHIHTTYKTHMCIHVCIYIYIEREICIRRR